MTGGVKRTAAVFALTVLAFTAGIDGNSWSQTTGVSAQGRIGGATRHETAALVALTASRPDGVAIVSAAVPWDALTAGTRFGTVLLVDHGLPLPDATRDALRTLSPGGVTAVGGEDAVSGAVLAEAACQSSPDCWLGAP